MKVLIDSLVCTCSCLLPPEAVAGGSALRPQSRGR